MFTNGGSRCFSDDLKSKGKIPPIDEKLSELLKGVRYDRGRQLVLADYLQSKGDPRGEMLAIDIALQEKKDDNTLLQQQDKLSHHYAPYLKQCLDLDIAVVSWFGGFPYSICTKRTDLQTILASEFGTLVKYASIEGVPIQTLPIMLDAHVRPATVEEILVGQMQGGMVYENVWYLSSVLACTQPNGDVKFAHCDIELLKELSQVPTSDVNGGIEISWETNARIPNTYTIASKEVGQYANKQLTIADAKNSACWKIFLSDEVRDKVLEYTALNVKQLFGSSGFGVRFAQPRKLPVVHFVGVNDWDYNSCNALGIGDFNCINNRFVGIVQENDSYSL